MMLALLLLLATAASGVEILPRAEYTAAVVEFAPKGSASDPASLILSVNIQDFENITQDAKIKGAEIIVFAEYGLTNTGCSSDRPLALDFSQIVPEPESQVNPCETFNSSMEYETIRRLSCMARDSDIIVVVNLIERVPCQNCAADDVLLYNTNVAFSGTGVVIARYRKFNLFAELALNQTSVPDISYFDALGVRFGLMTCFDIMFVSPAVNLVLDYNVTDMIFPTAWGSELPFLTAVQAQAAWSFSLDVNLLASGYSRPHLYSTGSGIYGGLRHGALVTLMADVETSEALVATLPPVESSRHVPLQATPRRFVTHMDDLSDYTSIKLEISNAMVSVQNCHGNFCCYLNYSVLNSTADFNYQFLTYDGFRTHAEGMYPSKLQVCALIACAFENHTSCAEGFSVSTYSLETVFSNVDISGVFKSDRVWPNTLYADTLNPVQPQDFSFSKVAENGSEGFMIRLNSTRVKSGLHTFALYSHDYEPYVPNSSSMFTFQFIIPLLIVWVLNICI